VRHQVEVEVQLVRRQALEQREDVAALRGGDEIIGVLDPGLDRLAADQLPDRVIPEPVAELSFRNWGVNRQK
jgi:hypothetical protein